MPIHPTAIVDRQAEIDPTADIGPYVVIDGPVTVEADTRIYPHAYLTGWTHIGKNCQIHVGAVVGHLPQDLHFEGGKTYCRIDDETVIREYATIHRGTQPETATVVGKACLILAGAHIAHNCTLGNRVTLINAAQLAGHVSVGDRAVVSAGAMAHQFVRIGELAMLSGSARALMDVPPFMTLAERGDAVGINAVGLRRAEAPREDIAEIKEAYRTIYRSGLQFRAAVEELDRTLHTPLGRRLVNFLQAPSKRGVTGPSERHTRNRVLRDGGADGADNT